MKHKLESRLLGEVSITSDMQIIPPLWLQSPSAVILEPPKIKSVTVSIISPSICHEVMDRMPWSLFFECWVLSELFHSPLSLSSRGSSSLLSAITVVLSAYLRLLILLPAILIPACASFSSRSMSRLYIVTLLICRIHYVKCWAGWRRAIGTIFFCINSNCLGRIMGGSFLEEGTLCQGGGERDFCLEKKHVQSTESRKSDMSED